MILPALLCMLGLAMGFLLIWRVPSCPRARYADASSLSIIIPARNEEHNLPRLLQSIASSSARPQEILVIDDASVDNTAALAASFGARVISAPPKPAGWTGKAWACHHGASQACGNLFLFLDADTHFAPRGLERILAFWQSQQDPRLVISILPFHTMKAAYEQLSLFFSILMAAGAGGFGAFAAPRLFGQSLLIAKQAYFDAGGHSSVRGIILENLRFASLLRQSGARILCLGGRGTLHMRMFPLGFRQMSQSWSKAFLQGAADSGPFVLSASILWITALWSTVLLFLFAPQSPRLSIFIVYLLFALQIAFIARPLGSFRFLACFLYPIPLAYYCGLFALSALHRAMGRKPVWRGRPV
jgi:4,4'-diaponeurosporenoate glycosyltransferase